MTFSDETIQMAWFRAGGRCECTRAIHNHRHGRCNRQLLFADRGGASSGAWEAHHRIRPAGDPLANCEVLCWDCHSSLAPVGWKILSREVEIEGSQQAP